MAKFFDGFVDHCLNIVGICDIEFDGMTIQLRGNSFGIFKVDVGNDHSCAFFREGCCNGFTNALTTSGDDGDFVFEFHMGSCVWF